MATITTPRLGSGIEGSARREAIRAFSEEYLTLHGDMADRLATVQNGTAPQAFKEVFRATLEALCAAVDSGEKYPASPTAKPGLSHSIDPCPR